MDFRSCSGDPLIPWSTPEEAFEAWKLRGAGRPCDYTGIQWPFGDERLYTDGVFNTDPDRCESYGHDLATGAELTKEEYAARRPGGRAFLHAVAYEPSPETPTGEYPLLLTTGRSVHQFHSRTKTARAPQLNAAAPEPWVEVNAADAAAAGIRDGDLVAVTSPRGTVRAPARIRGIRPGVVFIPFHQGYFDAPGAFDRAANELTVTSWDPVSKQPLFKVTAVRLDKVT
ncbi:molybdopterin dinucleotide binding domain-containing protein [Dactylosporangium sp. NPDC050588]|uniref:molybdopterin oxidoreductase family protein n=1 Tax=Dactylosporangium sp. NPDC050588 TaxID=3157211 RepID=UPI0033D56BA7